METKFNFDVIFTGTEEEQSGKAADFVAGWRRLSHDAEKEFAYYIVKNAPTDSQEVTARKVLHLRDAFEAFQKDPRTEELAKKCDKKKAQARREQLDEIARAAVTDLLK
jgi:hypothetical protein